MIFRPFYHFETGCAGYLFGCGTLGTCAAVDIREEDVDAALVDAGGDARVALVALLAGVDADDARRRLEGARGSVSVALGGAR